MRLLERQGEREGEGEGEREREGERACRREGSCGEVMREGREQREGWQLWGRERALLALCLAFRSRTNSFV